MVPVWDLCRGWRWARNAGGGDVVGLLDVQPVQYRTVDLGCTEGKRRATRACVWAYAGVGSGHAMQCTVMLWALTSRCMQKRTPRALF